MGTRPYFNKNVDELTKLATQNWSDLELLTDVQEELKSRKTPKARKLAESIRERLKKLASAGPQNGPSRKPGVETKEGHAAEPASGLKRRADEAERAAEKLRNRVDELERRLAELNDPDYSTVGLHPDAPDFVLVAARKAFQTKLHPDRHGETEKKRRAAEEALKQFEQVFHRLTTRRAQTAQQ